MAAANIKLSSGVIQDIFNGAKVEKPILQILGIKRLATGDRYRLFLSDGELVSSFAMLATQLNHHFDSGNVDKFAVIRINDFLCNKTQTNDKPRRIMIILDFALLVNGSIVGGKIGNPTSIDSTSAATSNNNTTVENGNSNVTTPALEVRNQSPSADHQFSNFNKMPQESRRDSLPDSSRSIQPITCVTPYQNRWTIKARVTSKSTIRTFTNARGEGKVFSVEMIDDSGDIKATAFGEQVDKYYDKLEVNKVYYVSRGQVKPKNQAFNKTSNDYEITFSHDTIIEPCNDSADIPLVQFSFVPIDKLNNKEVNSFVDVIGICKHVSDVQTILARNSNRELKKRSVNLVDMSNAEVSVTMWSKEAEDFDAVGNPVLAIKGAKISDFGGISLNISIISSFMINPDIPESHKLRAWYDSEGHKADYKSLSKTNSGGFSANWKFLADIKSEGLGTKDKSDYITVKAIIGLIRDDNFLYKACAEEQCKKKVVEISEDCYRCEKCNKESDRHKWNIIMKLVIADFTDALVVTCFQECAEKILGKPVDELAEISKETGGMAAVTAVATGKEFIFKLRVSAEYYNDEQHIRTSIMEVTPVNYVEYSNKLIADMKQMSK